MNFTRIIIILLSLSILIGCSKGANPLVPSGDDSITESRTAGDTSNHALIGWGDIICNSETGTIEIIPSRSEEFHLNLTRAIVNTMGIALEILPAQSDPANGLFVVDFILTHPLPGAPVFSGFDMKFILMTPGTLDVGGTVFADMDETRLLNSDGFSRWWNPTEFTNPGFLGYYPGVPGLGDTADLTATVNPYKLYADSLDVETPVSEVAVPALTDPDGRAIFGSGNENTRRFEIVFPVDVVPVIIFNYAIDVCWEEPVPNPPSEVPDDFPMAANQPEPFDIQVVIPSNTLEYLAGGGVTGDLRVQAMVADWQGMDAANMQAEINYVGVSAPTLLTGEIELGFVTENLDYVIYESDVTSGLLPGLSQAGTHMIIVRAESAGTVDYTQGGTTVGPAEPISMYQTGTVEIASVVCEADGNESFGEAVPIALGGSVIGTLCNPGGSLVNAYDYYTFDVAPGAEAFGTVEIHCDDEPTRVGLYDSSFNLLGQTYVSGGTSSLEYPDHLLPDTYFIEVATENEIEIVEYEIVNFYIEDPCDDAISFDYEVTVGPEDTSIIYTARKGIATFYTEVWIAYSQAETSGADTIYCIHSMDGGISWDDPVQVNTLEIACERIDPTIVRSSDGELYCGWIDYSSGTAEPFIAVSYDGGQTWDDEINLYDFEVNPLQPNNYPRGILLQADEDNRVHALWADKRTPIYYHLYYSYSDNYGVTWTTSDLVDDSTTTIQSGPAHWDMAVNASGDVAVVWTDRRHITNPPLTSLDVMCDTRDSGTGFGADVMVNPPTVDIEQTSPGVAVADDGTIHVAWVDRRNDGGFGGTNPPNTWELYYARSEDGGATFIAETEIPTTAGYSSSTYFDPSVEVSPWGNPYIFYRDGGHDLFVSKSCDGGDTWGAQVMAYEGITDTYILGAWCFDVGIDGSVFAVHADNRNEPGGGYTAWNLFMNVGM